MTFRCLSLIKPGVRIVGSMSRFTEPLVIRIFDIKKGTGMAMEVQKKEQVFQASRYPRKEMKDAGKISSGIGTSSASRSPFNTWPSTPGLR
jgi:hypothetical protein